MERKNLLGLLLAGSYAAGAWMLSHRFRFGYLGEKMGRMGRSGLILAGGGAVSWLLSHMSDASRLQTNPQNEEQERPIPQPRPRLPPPMHADNITVLSIDGGGIRGLIPAVLLTRLEKMLQVTY